MSNWLPKLRAGVASAHPGASNPYWRVLPLRRMTKLLLGTFLTAACAGFAIDLLQLNRPSLGHGFFWPLFFGVWIPVGMVASIKKRRLALPVALFGVVLAGLAIRAVIFSTPLLLAHAFHQRVVFDAFGIWLGAALGTRLLFSFVTTEGLHSVRMHTELSLAHGIQATLVPSISWHNVTFEVYGKSIPSTEMGGDLIDLIESDGKLLAYVGDVSGHGLPAGQLMGMLKTAMRVSLQFRQHPTALLESADRVLPVVKETDMYATAALLYFDGSAEAEYALAGHVPILHYRDRSRDTARLSMEQFPLGLFPGGDYASQRVTYAPRDLFLMLTDGISDVPNDRDEEYGLARLEQLLVQHSTQPLTDIWELIMKDVRRHGLQQDDQTLLLVRVCQ